MARRGNRKGTVLAEMARHPGVIVTADAIAQELGTPEEREQIQSALSRLVTDGQIQRVSHGSYVYRAPRAPKAPGLDLELGTNLEYIGTTQRGVILLRTLEGLIYEFKLV